MKPINRILAAAVLAALLGAGTAGAAPDPQSGEPVAATAKTLYREGHDALERDRWDEAFGRFAQLEAELRRTQAKGVDAALYWQAYAAAQEKRNADVERLVRRLGKEYPDSVWKDDARALLPAGSRAPHENAGRAKEEEALMAIDALLTSGNKRAVPLLQRVLAGDYSDKVKERALFVLTQVDPTAADVALMQILKGDAPSRLKEEAIRSIAVGGSKVSQERLLEIYRTSPDPKLRRSVIEAWMISGRGDLVRDAAKSEQDPQVRRRAIETLGVMGDVEAIRALLPTLTDERSQRAAMEAFGIAGAAEALGDVAKNPAFPIEMRVDAVESLGMVGKGKAGPLVMEFYGPDQPKKLRKAAIQALMMQGDGKRLIEIYKRETDPAMKKEVLQAIAITDSDGMLDLVDEVLK